MPDFLDLLVDATNGTVKGRAREELQIGQKSMERIKRLGFDQVWRAYSCREPNLGNCQQAELGVYGKYSVPPILATTSLILCNHDTTSILKPSERGPGERSQLW
jgi:hypothetical protein